MIIKNIRINKSGYEKEKTMGAFTGKTLIKTRTEDNVNSCETNKQIAYAQAKADYDNAIIKCRQESSTNYCYTQALAKYERSKRTSDRVYEECIKK